MGEVFRARDTRLRRDVAIKALPDAFARDAERKARFEREAPLLGALNHANIATLYGIEEAEGAVCLVLELIEGEGLEQKLAGGALPFDEALGVASQVAAGLEAAHGVGIIHRDLKPSNVKVRPDGTVKVLDFGLARLADDPAASDVTSAATVTSGGTGTGIVLGTAAYMSPEQARGKRLDRRTDVFSFGCLLYECLTGLRAFRGETASDTMAAVLTAEPDWTAPGADAPPRLTALLKRCLQKDLARRLRDIGDARLEIEEIRAEGSTSSQKTVAAGEPGGRPPGRPVASLAWGVAGLAVGALLVLGATWLAFRTKSDSPRETVAAFLPVPEGVRLRLSEYPGLEVSPDGRTIVFSGEEGGKARLYRHALATGTSEPIPGTERGTGPLFSPDGQWLGFITTLEMKKVLLAGGVPSRLADVTPVTAGATWMPDGSVVLATFNNRGLYRVGPDGGAADEPFLPLDAARGEHSLLWPQALPGGRGILATAVRGEDYQDLANAEVVVIETSTKKRHVLIEGSTFARFLPPGRLVFVRGGAVLTVSFDLTRLRVVGSPVAVRQPIAIEYPWGTVNVDVTPDGTLVFVAGPRLPEPASSVVLFDRAGKATALPLAPGYYDYPAFSPDGRRIALQKCIGASCKLHIWDRERGVLSPLATEPGRFFSPVWSPDGRDVAFAHILGEDPRAALRAADGSGAIRRLSTGGENAVFPNAISPDGRYLLYTAHYDTERGGTRRRGTSDIWILPLDGSGSPRPWFESAAREVAAAMSPDGQWVAYVSNETGRVEVYVRPFPEGTSKLKISQDGGIEPVWTRGGKEIVYRNGDQFLAVEFRPGAMPSAGAPHLLFAERLWSGLGWSDRPRLYDVTRNGQEFVAIRMERGERPDLRLAVATNWTAGLEPAGGK